VSDSYLADFNAWIAQTTQLLREHRWHEIDVTHLIEEVEDLGKSERRAIASQLTRLLLHLLKWQYQPERRSGSWEGSIIEHRRRIKKALKESPSLKPYLESIFAESYLEAVKQAKAETALPLETFPIQCQYELTAVVDDEFLPLP